MAVPSFIRIESGSDGDLCPQLKKGLIFVQQTVITM